jgi:hypothetical protein
MPSGAYSPLADVKGQLAFQAVFPHFSRSSGAVVLTPRLKVDEVLIGAIKKHLSCEFAGEHKCLPLSVGRHSPLRRQAIRMAIAN